MKKLLFYMVMCAGLFSCSDKTDEGNTRQRISSSDVAALLKGRADLATTEVQVEKVVYYDESSKTFPVSDIKSNIKQVFGNKTFLFPIRGTLQFGLDMQSFSEDNVVEKDSILIITLPEPAYIQGSAKFNNIDSKKLVKISTGLRGDIGTTELREAKQKNEQLIIDSSNKILENIKPQLKDNVKSAFLNMLRIAGWEHVDIVFESEK